jgi:hypothetical protein
MAQGDLRSFKAKAELSSFVGLPEQRPGCARFEAFREKAELRLFGSIQSKGRGEPVWPGVTQDKDLSRSISISENS